MSHNISPTNSNNNNFKDQSTSTKRNRPNTETSPSISKNPKLMEQASTDLALYFKKESEVSSSTSIEAMKLSQLRLGVEHIIILVKVQYKYDLRKTDRFDIGQFIVYDTEQNNANIICFNQPSISKFYNTIQEGNILRIRHPQLRPTNLTFSLCQCQMDIILSSSTKVEILKQNDDLAFHIPFNQQSIASISQQFQQNNVIDCIAAIASPPDVTEGPKQQRASVKLQDLTGTITLTAWGSKMVTCLYAATQLPQQVFAFQRLKCKIFQEQPQLYLNEGSEILLQLEDENFDALTSYYKQKEVKTKP